MNIFHVNGKVYGWIFAFLSVGFIGSSQFNGLLLKKYRSDQIVFGALIGQCLAALIFLIGTLNGWFGLYGTVAMLFLFLSCLGITNPNASALSLAPFSKNAGSASALMGALQLGMGALASIGVSLFNTQSALPMVAIIAGTTVLALLILLVGRSRISEQVEVQKGQAAVLH